MNARSALIGLLLVASFGVGRWARCEESTAPSLPPPVNRTVDFAAEVRPLLARRCFSCHGPQRQESGLRLDQRAAALRGGDWGEPAIAPGKSAESLLVRAVAGVEPDLIMPPKGERLSAEEIGLLRAWIDQGAPWMGEDENAAIPGADHWAFQPLTHAPAPHADDSRVLNPIDAFLWARLRAENLEFSPPASRPVFIRRIYLDVLGLPPTPEEVAAFVADESPDAVERLVDRVLASPHLGERWGRHWFDVVRFAETSGFETNFERPNAYRYRDYVIRAFNEDKPYDQFIMEQLAGDALGVDAATGFLVAGANDRVKSPDIALTLMQRQDELADMLNTTGTAFLGLTIGCARCHNHKFDPITQRDYYALQAVFAGVEHGERPLHSSGTDERRRRLADIESQINSLRRQIAKYAGLREPVNTRANEERFPPTEVRFVRFTVRATNNGIEPCIDELEIYAASSDPTAAANVALAALGARATASGVYPNSEIHRLEHINDGRHGNGRSWISNTHGAGWVQIELAAPTTIDRIVWGRDREGRYQDRTPIDYVIEGAMAPDQWRVLASSADRVPWGAEPTAVWAERIGALPSEERQGGQSLLAELQRLESEHAALQQLLNASVYAGVFKQPGATHRLYRGDPMQPREEVAPAAPEILAKLLSVEPLPADAPEQQRRLQLAKWIVDPNNPLTARVIVNRLWQYHFGTGLVATSSDFGKMGVAPSHPELLDWMAAELIRSGWSLKHIHRLILTSWAYRQASEPNTAAAERDAESRLLWRFPPRRLEAEAIRDSMLAVSGALDRSMYGPSFSAFKPNNNYVRVYEPKESWGPPEWRRMVYMLKVRMEQDAVFGAFDCPDGGQPAPRRTASTTPLQALNLLHSEFAIQQSQLFAQRLRKEVGDESSAQVHHAFLLALGREPASEELAAAVALVEQHGLTELCRALFNANEFLFLP